MSIICLIFCADIFRIRFAKDWMKNEITKLNTTAVGQPFDDSLISNIVGAGGRTEITNSMPLDGLATRWEETVTVRKKKLGCDFETEITVLVRNDAGTKTQTKTVTGFKSSIRSYPWSNRKLIE